MRLLAFASAVGLLTGCGIKHAPTPTSATGASQQALPCGGTRYAIVANGGRDPITVLAQGGAVSRDLGTVSGGGVLGVVEPGRESRFALTGQTRAVAVAGRSSDVTGTRGVRITYQCE